MNSDPINFISKLEIENFKSIKHVKLSPKRVNLLIGQPNSGKSNILEALGLLSSYGNKANTIRNFVRIKEYSNLFHNDDTSKTIKITVNNIEVKLKQVEDRYDLFVNKENVGLFGEGENTFYWKKFQNESFGTSQKSTDTKPNRYYEVYFLENYNNFFQNIKFYKFRSAEKTGDMTPGALKPPSGINLFKAIYNSPKLKDEVEDLLDYFDYFPNFRTNIREIELMRRINGSNVSHSLSLAADTLKSLIFHYAAISSNQKSIIIFEEPEVHLFPFYIQDLANRIAKDEQNQYFIATHNIYLLEHLLNKTKSSELQIFLVYTKDFESKIKKLTESNVATLFKGDPFFTLNKLED